MKTWQIKDKELSIGGRTLVMGILNVTPDSFSDGGKFFALDEALRQAEKIIKEGADILDIGGESTRPQNTREAVSAAEETRRVAPVIAAIKQKFPSVPLSVDTTKADVARAALAAGAEIINDISGLRFDEGLADVAAATGAGLILMHSRGALSTLHTQPPVEDIMREVAGGLRRSLDAALSKGVKPEQVALDPGFGFGKTFEQNLELLNRLDELLSEFADYPFLIGTSRKSFIGKLLGDVPPTERLNGSLATATVAALKGAHIIRVHDVKATVEVLKITDAVRGKMSEPPA